MRGPVSKWCESHLGASGPSANEKGSQVPLILEGKSKRQIAREHNHSRKTVDKAVDTQPPQPYRLSRAKPSPVFGAFRARADELLAENAHLPPKQQYTGHKLYELLQAEGYQGSEARVRLHMTQWNKAHHAPALFLPLEFDPGQDAQVDWVRRVGAYEIPV